MKRTLSLLLALVLVLGTFSTVFAAMPKTAEEKAELLKELGVLIGDESGNLRLDKDLNRAEGIVLLSRLMKEEDVAKEFETEGLPFTDIKSPLYQHYVAWAFANEYTAGKSATEFDPEGELTAIQYATFVLRALGYEVDAKAFENGVPFEKAKELGIFKDLNVTAETVLKRKDAAVMTFNALYVPMKDKEITLGEYLELDLPQEEPEKLEVKDVSVNTAKSFLVKFNKAVEDTSKIEFAVKRGSVAAKVTVKWNEEKTEATLEASTKLAEGDYTVTVTDKSGENAVTLGEYDLVVEKEKIVSIDFDSDVIVRISDEKGIVGFTVRNQYGEDITNSALARSLTWLASTNKTPVIDYKAGIIVLEHNGAVLNQLKDLKTVVITVRDSSTGFVVSKNFTVSDTLGIVNDVKLLGVVDEKGNQVDFTFSKSKTYYLDFEAYDVNGRKIDFYSALTSSQYAQEVLEVRSSNESLVKVIKERHPQDNTKLALRLEIVASDLQYDTPVTFIAVAPFTGKSSTLTVTLQRSARVEKFVLMTPAETVTANKSVEIPFVAYDQYGNEVTRYDDIVARVKIPAVANADIRFVRQSDGSAKLYATFYEKQLYYITATVDGSITGSYSYITIDVKDRAVPSSIEALRHAHAYTTGASWTRRINNFTIRDQFDGSMNLRIDPNNKNYKVKITSSNKNIIDLQGDNSDDRKESGNAVSVTINEDQAVKFVGGAQFGSVTITYELLSPEGNLIDSATTVAYNVDPNNIVSAKINALAGDEIYMLRGSDKYYNNGRTDAGNEAAAYFEVVGVTKDGMEVRIPSSMTSPITVSDKRFTVSGTVVYADGDFGNSSVVEATVTGYVYNSNGLYLATTTLKANSAAPKATSIDLDYSIELRRDGKMKVANDVVTISKNDFMVNFIRKSVFYIDANGNGNGNNDNLAPAYFAVNTQYAPGCEGVPEKVLVTTKGTGNLIIDPVTGVIDANSTVAEGDEYIITAIASNGLTRTLVIKITN